MAGRFFFSKEIIDQGADSDRVDPKSPFQNGVGAMFKSKENSKKALRDNPLFRGNDGVQEEVREGNEENFGVEGQEAGNVAGGEEYGREAGVDEQDVGFKCAFESDIGE
ncbi:hypothetical protein BHYA_0643g00010 [Botrytis hyacinthi]|uniref:Uncharacterized protein n=1 Tax=Botrytis hyacinthi TaxID=278943 RepID=A0A4Z1G3F7_9HELO|nr:hypothetical protein BHYA_0643g00010 [Botrytis hyacinthi]